MENPSLHDAEEAPWGPRNPPPPPSRMFEAVISTAGATGMGAAATFAVVATNLTEHPLTALASATAAVITVWIVSRRARYHAAPAAIAFLSATTIAMYEASKFPHAPISGSSLLFIMSGIITGLSVGAQLGQPMDRRLDERRLSKFPPPDPH